MRYKMHISQNNMFVSQWMEHLSIYNNKTFWGLNAIFKDSSFVFMSDSFYINDSESQ